MADDVGDLLGVRADVDRVEHRARFEDAVIGLEQLVGVVGDEADSIARPDAELLESVGEAVGPFTELAIG